MLTLLAAVVMSFLSACGSPATASSHGRIAIVAAENFYGDLARQVGGRYVTVSSLLSNPNVDPHEFQAGTSAATTLSQARLVIENGAGYDAWVDNILGASSGSNRSVITVAKTVGVSTTVNPHLWYMPSAWPVILKAIARHLTRILPSHASYFRSRSTAALRALAPVLKRIRSYRRRYHGLAIAATEPVYDYMASALGLRVLNPDFQKAVMDGTEPPPQSFERLKLQLQHRAVRLLLYNSQVVDPVTTAVRQIARSSRVSTVGISELEPAGTSFAQWQQSQLAALGRALTRPLK